MFLEPHKSEMYIFIANMYCVLETDPRKREALWDEHRIVLVFPFVISQCTGNESQKCHVCACIVYRQYYINIWMKVCRINALQYALSFTYI